MFQQWKNPELINYLKLTTYDKYAFVVYNYTKIEEVARLEDTLYEP